MLVCQALVPREAEETKIIKIHKRRICSLESDLVSLASEPRRSLRDSPGHKPRAFCHSFQTKFNNLFLFNKPFEGFGPCMVLRARFNTLIIRPDAVKVASISLTDARFVESLSETRAGTYYALARRTNVGTFIISYLILQAVINKYTRKQQ
jgi:hypothetical protein